MSLASTLRMARYRTLGDYHAGFARVSADHSEVVGLHRGLEAIWRDTSKWRSTRVLNFPPRSPFQVLHAPRGDMQSASDTGTATPHPRGWLGVPADRKPRGWLGRRVVGAMNLSHVTMTDTYVPEWPPEGPTDFLHERRGSDTTEARLLRAANWTVPARLQGRQMLRKYWLTPPDRR
jgi:hypothetical protein